MRPLTITLLACAALSGTALLGADEKKAEPKPEASDRAAVTTYLKKHVLGKTVATPKTTFKWDDNKVEGDVEDQTTYNNFSETAEGLCFDMVTVSKITHFDLDAEGKRVPPGRGFSGTTVLRYELCERASTKKLTGAARFLSTTVKGPSTEGMAVLVTGVKVADGKLSWDETLPGYGDVPAAKGKYRARSFDGKYTFAVVDGKLRVEYDQTNFDVDPDTLKRTPTKEKLPSFVSLEIEQKE
jgi:hypothetical protein